MDPLRAVFFDLDGVLVDSEGVWRESSRQAFAAVGIALTDALYAECAGLDGVDGVRAVLREFPDVAADAAALKLDIERRVRRALSVDPRVMPGAGDLLRELSRRGVPLALVSAAPRELIDLALDSAGWRSHFRVVLSTEDVGPGKPDPAVYREAVRRLGAGPEDAVAVEDTWAGVQAARGAGLEVVAIPTDGAPVAKIQAQAVFVAADLRGAAMWLLARLDPSTASVR